MPVVAVMAMIVIVMVTVMLVGVKVVRGRMQATGLRRTAHERQRGGQCGK